MHPCISSYEFLSLLFFWVFIDFSTMYFTVWFLLNKYPSHWNFFCQVLKISFTIVLHILYIVYCYTCEKVLRIISRCNLVKQKYFLKSKSNTKIIIITRVHLILSWKLFSNIQTKYVFSFTSSWSLVFETICFPY